jgi:hypothetical protein
MRSEIKMGSRKNMDKTLKQKRRRREKLEAVER